MTSGDHLQTKLYDPQWKLNRTAWFANNMLQHAEDDSLASGDHLQIKLYDPQSVSYTHLTLPTKTLV